ncbi:MAG TPA: tripartite tricarboxylate transporter TctB family protein [Candidatus Limnocylindria bacterium]|nr:tripartite tricarboxylate transporter TctB family protein [Candidatus Limnocylindria bacterium]
MLGGLAVIRAALELPPGTATDPLGPRGFPLLLGAGLAACGAALLVTSVRVAGREAATSTVTTEDEARLPYSWRRVSGAVAATVVYILALVPLGALLASMGYALALLLLQGRTGRREAVVTVVAFPVFVYVLVGVLLGVPLPAGPLEPLLRWLRI